MKDLQLKVGLFVICILLGCKGSLYAKYCLDAGKGNIPVQYIKVVSERCSGSYYVSALLTGNIENLYVMDSDKYGIKHFSPWFGYESSYYGPDEDYTFENSENVLFVILFRDPYEWLSSFKQTTFLGPANLQVCDFSAFIRGEWGINMNYENVVKWKLFHPLIDLNPINGLPFENVIKLRTKKIENFLEIPKRVQNYYILNYEKARDWPKEVVEEVAEIFSIPMKSEYIPVTKIRGIPQAEIYKQKKYQPISIKDLLYINKELDETVENSIGYELKSLPLPINID